MTDAEPHIPAPDPTLTIERLKVRADFLRASKARRWATPGLILQYRKRQAAEHGESKAVRVGFTASKKVGNAVARNRAKRRLRELATEILSVEAKAGCDYVLIGRTATLDRPYENLRADLRQAMKKVHAPRPKKKKPKPA